MVVSFGNFFRVASKTQIFRSARETAAKFSAVRLPLKQRVSTARSFSIQKLAVCHAIAWVAHEVEPSLVSATPSVACALRRHFISSMARWLARRKASCVQDGTLYSGARKKNSHKRKPDQRRQKAALDRSTGSASTTHALIGRSRSRSCGW